MLPLVTASQMRDIDRLAIEKQGIPSLTLMERAGDQVFLSLKERFHDLTQKRVLILTGKGNNAGDGFVVARLLAEAGVSVQVWMLVSPEELSQDARVNYEKLVGVTLRGCPVLIGQAQGSVPIQSYDIIVDALFGTGLKGDSPKEAVPSPYREAIDWINQRKTSGGSPFVAAVDIPSGLSADSGKILGSAVRADLTVTLGLPKRGLFLAPGTEYAGEVKVVDIGIPEQAVQKFFSPPLRGGENLITGEEVRSWFSPRKKESHKGDYGHVLVVAGSSRKMGAALMTVKAALRTGSGLVTLALPDRAYQKIPRGFLEVMYEPLPSTPSGEFHRESWKHLKKVVEGKDVVAIGPGMGTGAGARSIVKKLLSGALPLVIDADGLNGLPVLKKRRYPTVLTPHPGEMARLLGLKEKSAAQKVQQNRWDCARRFSTDHRCYLVLKGYRTVVGIPDGTLFINTTGNPGMATAGMGDVLTGMIASLIGQGMEAGKAVAAAVYLHGLAGDNLLKEKGDRGLLAGDLMEKIPSVIKEMMNPEGGPSTK